MNIKHLASEVWWQARYTAKRLWLIVRHRPLITCPICKGVGGEISGYYEPEWSECSACWHHWEDLEDHGMPWFVGRLPLLMYVRARLSLRFGLWYPARFRDVLGCKLGIHSWMSEEESCAGPGTRLCGVCYAMKKATPSPESEAPKC